MLSKEIRDTMRICMISSYPPAKDGVAHYCNKLCEAITQEDTESQVLVLSNNSSPFQNRRLEVIKAWTSDSIEYPFRILRTVSKWKPEVIHIQHEYWLFGRDFHSISFILLLLLLGFVNRPVFVTMHQIVPREELTSSFFQKRNSKRFTTVKTVYKILYDRLIERLSSAIIVHLQIAKRILVNDYSFAENRIHVIPHGISIDVENTSLTDSMAKDLLNLQDKRVLLFFGEIRRGKGLEFVIKAMPRITALYPNCVCLIAGQFNPNSSPESRDYLKELEALSRNLKLEEKVIFKAQFIPDSDIPIYFAAADVVLLPYSEDGFIYASGPLSLALGFSKPIAATRIRRFLEDLVDNKNAILFRPDDPDELADAANRILGDRQLSLALSENTKSALRGRNWRDVALKTLTLYGQIQSYDAKKHIEIQLSS
jgi:glycosyltransferase involved in cell wall biosynthesis